MSSELLAVALVVTALGYAGLAWWDRRSRARLGLGAGRIVAADDSPIGSPTLRSERLGLVGRCDHLLRVGRADVPVEQKPGARRLYDSHRLQVGALCLLVEEASGVRPPRAIVVLAEGRREVVPFTAELERDVLGAMAEMRAILAEGRAPEPCWAAAKCRSCGYRERCWG